ncbi:MAG: hypothetical protein KZQ93_15970 [Candidatus Thiodiazotropha sp. (ex Monitilora ramsayi)]|nr:hypothetical protein [Candidatus Thiodiazotropha sp. (ex Monitilora ramsayi)]
MSENSLVYGDRDIKPRSLDAFKTRACTLPFGNPDYRPPDPEEVAALTELMGWSQSVTARLVGVNYDPKKGSTTVRKWKTSREKKEHREIPYAAWRLMLLYAGVVALEDKGV